MESSTGVDAFSFAGYIEDPGFSCHIANCKAGINILVGNTGSTEGNCCLEVVYEKEKRV